MPVYKSKTKTKDGRQYYFSVSYVVNGKQQRYKSKKYVTKKETEKAEALYILNNTHKGDTSQITFSQLIQVVLDDKVNKVKPQSYQKLIQYFGHIDSQIGSVVVEKFTANQYEDFRKWIQNQNWSLKYKRLIDNYVRLLLDYAFKKYDINNRVAFKYDKLIDPEATVHEMQILTYDEFTNFLSVIPDDEFIYKCLFIVLFFSCCRIGELNALAFNDVDFDNSTISINKTVTTKMRGRNSKYLILAPKTKSSIRVIPIPKVALDSLKMCQNHFEKIYGFTKDWYCFGGLNPLPETTITKRKNKYCKLSNNKQIRLHDFRHSGASYYAHLNCPVTALSKLLGHASTYQTLSTYSHYYITDLHQLMTKVDEFVPNLYLKSEEN